MITARENILSRIKKALEKSTEKPMAKPDFSIYPYVKNQEEHIEVVFAENFKKNKGDFFYCENIEAFLSSLKAVLKEKDVKNLFAWEEYLQELLKVAKLDFTPDDQNLREIQGGITLCELLIARTGSILISSKQKAGRRLGAYTPIHFVLAFTSQLVFDVKDSLQTIRQKYKEDFPSMLSVISGPSQTADIEKTLVLGAHGPKEIILFLIDDITENNPTQST